MKRFYIFASVFLLFGGLFSAHAQDMIVLLNGNIIEAKVMEIHPSEIRYKRFDNLNGPVIIISKDSVLSIKYENGLLEIINAPPSARNERGQTERAGTNNEVSGTNNPGMPMQMQTILNALPAIPIAGNNLKFQFDNDKWTATVNGENFSAGTIEREDTNDGSILTLKQTHIWPGTAGKTAGKVANMIPGGGAVGSALNTAGSIAGAAGAVEAAGPVIVLEYKAGPPAKLSLLRSTTTTTAVASDNRTTTDRRAASENRITDAHPLYMENRFDLDGFNVFALSITGMPPIFIYNVNIGATITIFEKYKPNEFLGQSYFLSIKHFNSFVGSNLSFSAGVLIKHILPMNTVLWNLGASLDLYVYSSYDSSSLVGIGAQTGFSFRFNPYTSFDINGFLKFPFGTADVRGENIWPVAGGIEIGLTFWFPYRSK